MAWSAVGAVAIGFYDGFFGPGARTFDSPPSWRFAATG